MLVKKILFEHDIYLKILENDNIGKELYKGKAENGRNICKICVKETEILKIKAFLLSLSSEECANCIIVSSG